MRVRLRIGERGDTFIIYWLSLVIAGLVVLVNHLSYGADGNFYLNFPVHGYNSSNAPISSIFDHSVEDAVKGDDDIWRNGTITAFTGDTGYKNNQDNCGNCFKYSEDSNQDFVLEGVNYEGTESCGPKYLCYEGHNGIDYKFVYGTPLYPAISGTVTYPDDQSDYHGLMINSEDGKYRVYYLHLSSWLDRTTGKIKRRNSDGTEDECTECAKEGEWVDINRTQPIGYVGDYQSGWGGVGAHLHLGVHKKINNIYERVDPYGWEGSDTDPYEKAKGVKNVDLWSAPSTNIIIHTLTAPSKTTVSRGGLLGLFTVQESNNSSSYYAFNVQPYVAKPDGTTVNFKKISTGLAAGKTRTLRGYLRIPSSSELGTFTFGAKLTDTSGNAIDDDSFEFTVVSGSIYASKRSDRKLKRLLRTPETQVVEEAGWEIIMVPERNR